MAFRKKEMWKEISAESSVVSPRERERERERAVQTCPG